MTEDEKRVLIQWIRYSDTPAKDVFAEGPLREIAEFIEIRYAVKFSDGYRMCNEWDARQAENYGFMDFAETLRDMILDPRTIGQFLTRARQEA